MNSEVKEKFIHTAEYIPSKEFSSDLPFFGNVVWDLYHQGKVHGQEEFYIPYDENFRGEMYWKNHHPIPKPLTPDQQRLLRPSDTREGRRQLENEGNK